MSDQRTFSSLAWSQKGKVTRRERFLAEMDAVILWARLLERIEPYYPKPGLGRRPLGLETGTTSSPNSTRANRRIDSLS